MSKESHGRPKAPRARPAPRANSKPASQPASKPTSKPISNPASKPRSGRPPKPRSAPRTPRDPARDAAYSHLAHQAARFPDLSIFGPDVSGLSPRDAAFAHAISDAAQRHWITLVYLLSVHMHRNWADNDPGLRGALLGGAAQILYLDRVPPHAVLDESVEWAKSRCHPSAGGVVNAILRKIAEQLVSREPGPWRDEPGLFPMSDGRILRLKDAPLPENEQHRLSVASSCPLWLIQRWAEAFSPQTARDLALHAITQPPTILNVAHARSAIEPGATGLTFRPHEQQGSVVVEGPREALSELLTQRQDLWAQDPSSCLAVRSVADLTPRLVVDLCAGQGTKTRQLAATFPAARIVASDADPDRLLALKRLAQTSRQIEALELAALKHDFAGTADLVLLDVPCTNTGVLARRAEARYRGTPQQLARLVGVQRGILADALRLLKKGGRILYSTCSVEREENETQIASAPAMGFTPERVTRTMPVGRPGEDPTRYRDGAFSALLSPTG